MCVERAYEAICSGLKFEMRFVKVGRLTGDFLRKWRVFEAAISERTDDETRSCL